MRTLQKYHTSIARQGDPMQCHVETDYIKEGVKSIQVNGKPLARLNHASLHSGVIHTSAANAKMAPYQAPSDPLTMYPSVEIKIASLEFTMPPKIVRIWSIPYYLTCTNTIDTNLTVSDKNSVNPPTFDKDGFKIKAKHVVLSVFSNLKIDKAITLFDTPPHITLTNHQGSYTISLTQTILPENILQYTGSLTKSCSIDDKAWKIDGAVTLDITITLSSDHSNSWEDNLAYNFEVNIDKIKNALTELTHNTALAFEKKCFCVRHNHRGSSCIIRSTNWHMKKN